MKSVMETIIQNAKDPAAIKAAGDIIKKGGLVAFPTETVYGLGADALNPMAAKKIYAAKGRPSDNPLIIHICDRQALSEIAKDVPETAEVLMDAFWPGPLTMIFRKSERVPYETTGGLDTVAVRMPEDPSARAFIAASGGFIAAPSANTSGRPSPTTARHVAEDLSGKIDMILDGGPVSIGVESTILDMSVSPPMILRPGAVTKEMLTRKIGEVSEDASLKGGREAKQAKAPGMKYRHYAPKAPLTLVEGNEEDVIEKINALVKKETALGKKVGIISTEETFERYPAGDKKSIGTRLNESTIAQNLYRILREFDEDGVDEIYSEFFDGEGMASAIRNRLLKAAGQQVIHV